MQPGHRGVLLVTIVGGAHLASSLSADVAFRETVDPIKKRNRAMGFMMEASNQYIVRGQGHGNPRTTSGRRQLLLLAINEETKKKRNPPSFAHCLSIIIIRGAPYLTRFAVDPPPLLPSDIVSRFYIINRELSCFICNLLWRSAPTA
ncbi:MFS multidrug [Cordyceps militaris]|uniref:MFS multidrug n=1 Tax=Cordyceps militaris TaxID=73501 RepID=A0A2H4SMG1_CORMI|nr:MFS multidrug [Cordyceps militaris]